MSSLETSSKNKKRGAQKGDVFRFGKSEPMASSEGSSKNKKRTADGFHFAKSEVEASSASSSKNSRKRRGAQKGDVFRFGKSEPMASSEGSSKNKKKAIEENEDAFKFSMIRKHEKNKRSKKEVMRKKTLEQSWLVHKMRCEKKNIEDQTVTLQLMQPSSKKIVFADSDSDAEVSAQIPLSPSVDIIEWISKADELELSKQALAHFQQKYANIETRKTKPVYKWWRAERKR